MKKTLNLHDFRSEFAAADRGNQFSFEALKLIFEYLEEIYDQYELDVVAICCEFAESSVEEFADAYRIQADEVDAYLENNSALVGKTAKGLVYIQF
jgi:hypothetical protein